MMQKILYTNKWKESICFFIVTVVFFSCNNKKEDARNPEAIFFDYQISGEEGNDNLTVLLQYREGGVDGEAVSMGKVTLDGETLPADSTKMSGVFYELHKPIAEFRGNHTIILTGSNNKEYKEEFNFQPVELITQLPDSIKRGEMNFEFEGLEPEDYIRLLITDTSFLNDGINRIDTLKNGHLNINQSDMVNLANGPVQLQFIKEFERPVKNGTKEMGRLRITYRLKREVWLLD